jgi:hypothetical protein
MAWLFVVVAAMVIVVVFLGRTALVAPRSEAQPENPNANNPDALEADLDPEGDEPEGY